MNNPEIDEHGNQTWYNSAMKWHRDDGPAYVGSDGHLVWWVNGKRHRIDGPSIIFPEGKQRWYVNDQRIQSNKEFQVAANLTDEEMTALILKYGNVG